jgi:hypothetical protein
MQLACQWNSLNRRGSTMREIAELSEILTVQKNETALVRAGGFVIFDSMVIQQGLLGGGSRYFVPVDAQLLHA